ncbi:MAG TPA: hypothetical protein VKD24_00660 [Candidatus Angelobacter sp.]|nr:hypothetical protein [Candidatus Angelobacter sp.]
MRTKCWELRASTRGAIWEFAIPAILRSLARRMPEIASVDLR